MGYRSEGNGTIFFDVKNKRKIMALFRREGVDFTPVKEGEAQINFSEWKMYYSHKFFKDLASLVTSGNVHIEGEDAGDVWTILFENGKIGIQRTQLVDLEPTFDEAVVLDKLGEIDNG